MPDIIHLLPDSVANQIAAGEVIQRPASLIKELVENAIDAGATRIQVIVTDAGKSCVQVIDNGKGMTETDARLSFERHATSKITKADDLFALTTMGFRGEALASIAAVAQVELRTRTPDNELGVCLQIEGSKVILQEPIVCPVGANFLIKNLFFNIPARRKFLKSNHTELSNIVAEFERIALAHPDLSFALSTPDNVLLDLPSGNFRQRIVNIFGRKMDKYLMPVHVETELVEIIGFVGNPESSKKKGAQQFFFANGRYMRHPYFAKAIQSAYERLIPDGEQVPFFLQILINPCRIDVNIHPTKTEIKFEDEQPIWQILRAAVRETLGRFNAIPTIDFDVEDRPDIPVFQDGDVNIAPPSIEIDENYNPFANSQPAAPKESSLFPPASGSTSSYSPRKSAKGWEGAFENAFDTQDSLASSTVFSSDFAEAEETPAAEATLYEHLPENKQGSWTNAGTQYIQYKGRYIIAPSEEGLLMVDQHRAHVRILFEDYLTRVREAEPQSQGILFPQILEVSASQQAILEGILPELEAIGFELSYLGGNSFSILRVPSGLHGLDPVVLLNGMLDDATQKGCEVHEELVNTMALSLARKAAIPVGQEMSNEEMRDLIDRLFRHETPTFTPDGKRVFQLLPLATLLKPFE